MYLWYQYLKQWKLGYQKLAIQFEYVIPPVSVVWWPAKNSPNTLKIAQYKA